MIESDYDHLFMQLCNLKKEAPCHNGSCVGCQNCEYGINGCYCDKCAIDVVREEAERRYYSHKEIGDGRN